MAVIDEKYREVFVTVHVILRTAAMSLASALNRGSHPTEILKMVTNTGGGNSSIYGAHEVSLTNPLSFFTEHFSPFCPYCLIRQVNTNFSFTLYS